MCCSRNKGWGGCTGCPYPFLDHEKTRRKSQGVYRPEGLEILEAVYIDHMGDDLRVVNAARVSFHKEHKEFENNDVGLINYLAKHNHWTPFSHVVITLREKVPIFVARQRFKHMVGFTYNEVSRRYVDEPPEFFYPDAWRGKPINAKQGSSDEVINEFTKEKGVFVGLGLLEVYNDYIDAASELYASLIDEGVAPEQARMVLPQSMYTEYYVTGSLAAWARAYKLRIDPHAQKEIQDLAKIWGDVISGIKGLEYSWKALTL